MTASATQTELHPCACGCGTPVTGKYARGHWAKVRAAQAGEQVMPPLPDPDDDDDADGPDLDAGDFDLDEDELPDWLEPDAQAQAPRQPAQPDPPPGHVAPDRRRRGRGIPPPGKAGLNPVKVTATIRKDVRAKVGIVLVPATELWAMRDNVCGAVAVQQEPRISDALATLICDSPELLNWFTGPTGQFMKYFELFMAVLPILMAVRAHHLTHSPTQVRPVNPTQPPQMAAYAA